MCNQVRQRYPDWEVVTADSALAGISDVCRHPSRAVLVYMGGGSCRVEQEVAG